MVVDAGEETDQVFKSKFEIGRLGEGLVVGLKGLLLRLSRGCLHPLRLGLEFDALISVN